MMDSATLTHSEKAFTLFEYLNVPWIGQKCILVRALWQSIPGRSFQKQVLLSPPLSHCVIPRPVSVQLLSQWVPVWTGIVTQMMNSRRRRQNRVACDLAKVVHENPRLLMDIQVLPFQTGASEVSPYLYPRVWVQSADTWPNMKSSLATFFHQYKWQTPLQGYNESSRVLCGLLLLTQTADMGVISFSC